MEKTVIVPTANVEGNITSCRIEQTVKSVQRDSVFSFGETTTYVTYDVCNKQVIAEYDLPSVTGFGVFCGFTFAIILCVVAMVMSDNSSYPY